MKTSWTKGLEKDQVKEMEAHFLGASLLREKLGEILTSKISNTSRMSISKDAYKSPNWALEQADSVGYIRALEEVFSLIEN